MRTERGRLGFLLLAIAYAALAVACVTTLAVRDELYLGRAPWENLVRTVGDFSRPSFLDAWFGNPHFEYRSDSGELLRVEDRRAVERSYLSGLASAAWTTFLIGTLGSLLAAVVALPLGIVTARNLGAPSWARLAAAATLDAARSVHTLVFGLVLVGIVGLGPTAGILAIAAHSLGTYGKLYAEAIESLDVAAVDAVRAVGARPAQVFFLGVWPAVLPQAVSAHLYVWEFNVRDSTVLGLIGAGGLGMLISEAVSLFQWGRLATLLLVVVAMVTAFDAVSRRIRQALL